METPVANEEDEQAASPQSKDSGGFWKSLKNETEEVLDRAMLQL